MVQPGSGLALRGGKSGQQSKWCPAKAGALVFTRASQSNSDETRFGGSETPLTPERSGRGHA